MRKPTIWDKNMGLIAMSTDGISVAEYLLKNTSSLLEKNS